MSGDAGHRALIVVPCLNEEGHLAQLLADLAEDAAGHLIVVADGGSTDRSRAIVEAVAAGCDNVVLMDNPRRVQSAGINLAVRLHAGDRRWLVRIDAHCRYPKGYVAGLIRTAGERGAASVVVPMVSQGGDCFQRAAATAQNSKLGTGGSPHRQVGAGGYVDHGHHALMALETFRAAGGYNERMAVNEDAELDARIAATGGRIWLEPALAVTYFPRATPASLARQYWKYGRGRAQTVAMHKMALKPRQTIPLAIPPVVLLALLAPAWPWLGLPAAVWALACLAGGVALGVKARSVCSALSGVAAMIMHLAWGGGFLRERLFAAPPERTPPWKA